MPTPLSLIAKTPNVRSRLVTKKRQIRLVEETEAQSSSDSSFSSTFSSALEASGAASAAATGAAAAKASGLAIRSLIYERNMKMISQWSQLGKVMAEWVW